MPAADRSRASRAAFGGLATALCLIFLAAVRFSPTADLALYSLTSLCIAAVVVERGIRTAVLTWLAASVLSLVFPGFQTSLAFIGFFGFYPLAKAWIEGRKGLRALPAWGLKLLVFNALLAPGGFLVLGPLSGFFGGQVLLVPRSSGIDALVWALPVAALICALAGLATAFRRWRVSGEFVVSDAERELVDKALHDS